MSALELSLVAAALVIGLTGAWSPCGFSMVETIGLAGEEGRRGTTFAACATFAPGAIIGGIATFLLLSVLGEAIHGAGDRVADLAAAAIAVAAAVAEARGLRIAPQIRRQLPEGWRWTMPLPIAAALYGILLGLGFTTFVLTFGVWALAGISLALGDPVAGLLIGAAFGIGRALPVLLVAPFVDTNAGIKCIELMAERPLLYRAFRLGDALTLGIVAAALTATGVAGAAQVAVRQGADPSAVGSALAFQRSDRSGVLRFMGQVHGLPGRDPALGDRRAAVISGDQIQILDRFTRAPLGSVNAPHAQGVAISGAWIVYLNIHHGRHTLVARRLIHVQHPGNPRRLASVNGSAQIGQPSIDKGKVFYAVSKRHSNAIKRRSLGSGHGGTVLSSRAVELLNPSAKGDHLLYLRVSRGPESPQATYPRKFQQRLMLKRIGKRGGGHRIYSHGSSRLLWTTSLSRKRAFVTLLGGGEPKIVSIKR